MRVKSALPGNAVPPSVKTKSAAMTAVVEAAASARNNSSANNINAYLVGVYQIAQIKSAAMTAVEAYAETVWNGKPAAAESAAPPTATERNAVMTVVVEAAASVQTLRFASMGPVVPHLVQKTIVGTMAVEHGAHAKKGENVSILSVVIPSARTKNVGMTDVVEHADSVLHGLCAKRDCAKTCARKTASTKNAEATDVAANAENVRKTKFVMTLESVWKNVSPIAQIKNADQTAVAVYAELACPRKYAPHSKHAFRKTNANLNAKPKSAEMTDAAANAENAKPLFYVLWRGPAVDSAHLACMMKSVPR